ncbi:Uncharacterised protein [Burkholderia pseudomallei]|nr:Uncharacterised protein [Burkholderia pseudomallei]CAJ3489686.1 Uncharacterised protein [Burkholderia pseudomallei]CAJ3545099.1 Uncharacterised protein [Burkholderia pseudomallei]CAJ3602372.1 Uncharacterised protein [Burkholderia pseudomallei]CAJ3952785.1 Uncharacterised protein [Burkholderia pseudomallei]
MLRICQIFPQHTLRGLEKRNGSPNVLGQLIRVVLVDWTEAEKAATLRRNDKTRRALEAPIGGGIAAEDPLQGISDIRLETFERWRISFRRSLDVESTEVSNPLVEASDPAFDFFL